MPISVTQANNVLTVVFTSKQRWHWLSGLVVAGGILAFTGYGVRGSGTWIPLIEGCFFAGLVLAVDLRRDFSKDTLTVNEDSMTLERSVLGVRSRESFPRADVEKVGFQKETNGYRSHTDSGIGMMVRTHVLPLYIARTLSEKEAQDAFASIKDSGSWLASRIIPMGTPLF